MPTFRDDLHLGHSVPMVDTEDIVDGAITEPKLADDSVSTRTIQDGAVTEPKIAEKAITEPKLADAAVSTRTIKFRAVTESKIGDSAVSTRTIQNGAVTNSKIANSTISMGKLDNDVQTKIQQGTRRAWAPKGNYSAETVYNVNDLVYYPDTNSSYISLQANNQGHSPVWQSATGGWWMMVLDGSYLNVMVEELEQAIAQAIEDAQEDIDDAIAGANTAAQAANTAAANAEAKINWVEKQVDSLTAYEVATELDETSIIPVQNKVVAKSINELSGIVNEVAYPELKDTNFLANTTTLSFWVYGSGGNIVWGTYSSNYPYYNRVLPIKTYTKYRITAREQSTMIALLQDNVPEEGKVASDWNNGNLVSIPAGGVYEVDSDKYPYLSARYGGIYLYPEKVEELIFIKEVLDDIHDDIEELHNVEENVQGDYSVLGVGKACRSGDIVKTSDGKLLKMQKSIDVLTLTKVLAVGDLRYYGGSTYKVLKAVDNYDSTATYNAGDYALGVDGSTTISVYDGSAWSDATIAGMIADASLLESVDEEYIINYAAKPYNTSDVIFENASSSKELFDLSKQAVSVSNTSYITPVKTEKGGRFTVKVASTGVWRSAQFSIPTLVPNKKYMICCDYKSTLDTSFIVSLDVIYRDYPTEKELTPKVNINYDRLISCSGEYITDSNGRVAIKKGSGRIKIDASNLPSNVTFLCFRFEQKTVNSYLEISNISILEYENMKDVFDTFEYHETPEYLTQQEYLFQTHRMNKILDAYAGTHFTSLCLLHCSDAHGDRDNLRRIMKFAEQNPHIADVIHTGDIVHQGSTNPAYIDESGAEKMLQVIGNHDHSGGSVYRYSQAEMFAKYLKHIDEWNVTYTQDVCYYYKDYSKFALRLIVIDCMEYESNNNNHWETVQRQWFNNVLDDARQNNKRVIVATHCPIGDMTWLYNGFNELCTDSNFLFGGIAGTTPKQALTDMANDVQTFINNGGTFLTWLTGHIHYSRLGWLKDYPDQFQICAPTAGAYAPNGSSASYEAIRHYGLVNRDEFNILGLRNDTYRNAFYLLVARFGRTYNSHMQLADTLIVDLINKEILK